MNSNVSPTSCLKSSSTAQKLRLNKLKHILESESELLNSGVPLPQKSVKYLSITRVFFATFQFICDTMIHDCQKTITYLTFILFVEVSWELGFYIFLLWLTNSLPVNMK